MKDRRDIHFRSKALARLLRLCDEQGWRWRVGGDHVVCYPKDGSRPLVLSTTAYDGPVMKSMETRFEKAGLKGARR